MNNQNEKLPQKNEASTNIGYWEQVLNAPTPAYQELFEVEKSYLNEHIMHDSFVLDIRCGEGRNMMSIFQKTGRVYGIDNDPKAVKHAEKNFVGKDTVKVFCADAEKLPFEDETFDTVTFLMILPNLENNKVEAIIESARVLKQGGKLILSTFSETAFEERMKIYKAVGAPIKNIVGTKVIFDESLGANTSEQFSLDELISFGKSAGLRLVEHIKVGDIAYICSFEK